MIGIDRLQTNMSNSQQNKLVFNLNPPYTFQMFLVNKLNLFLQLLLSIILLPKMCAYYMHISNQRQTVYLLFCFTFIVIVWLSDLTQPNIEFHSDFTFLPDLPG